MAAKVLFDYDVLGRRTLVSRPNGVKSSYQYDAGSQVLSIVHVRAGAVLSGFTYEYEGTINGRDVNELQGSGDMTM